jgi:hypothetical protein
MRHEPRFGFPVWWWLFFAAGGLVWAGIIFVVVHFAAKWW